ncbi:hypothetical protein V8C44DRAFT_342590 [Trichoderma aethiopicum]
MPSRSEPMRECQSLTYSHLWPNQAASDSPSFSAPLLANSWSKIRQDQVPPYPSCRHAESGTNLTSRRWLITQFPIGKRRLRSWIKSHCSSTSLLYMDDYDWQSAH